MPIPRVVVVNPPSNPVPVTLTESPSVTIATPVDVQQASPWSVRIVGTPTVNLAPDSTIGVTVAPALRTATVTVGISRQNPCQSLYTAQADPANPSGRIWHIESVNGRIYAPSDAEIPPFELRAEAPSPNFAGFTLHSYYLGINRAKVAYQLYVFNDALNAYAIRSQAYYPQVCFTVPVEQDWYVELTFTGRLLDCADGLNACP
jgi:hypothetical protein